jgi:Rv2175c C-terminal domain of unknown function
VAPPGVAVQFAERIPACQPQFAPARQFADEGGWGKDVDVAQIDPPADTIVGEWLSTTEVAERLSLPVNRVKQLLRDRKLLGVQRPDGSFGVPAAFLDGDQVVRGLHGTLTLLFDCGFTDVEAMRWLFTSDETLPGSPIQAIAEHRCSEVNRRAQALAF